MYKFIYKHVQFSSYFCNTTTCCNIYLYKNLFVYLYIYIYSYKFNILK